MVTPEELAVIERLAAAIEKLVVVLEKQTALAEYSLREHDHARALGDPDADTPAVHGKGAVQ